MFNVGGGELLVILIVALVVLGPAKLPEVARQVGGMARELRRMSASFQAEMKSALDEPVEEESRERGRRVVGSEEQPAPATDEAASIAPSVDPSPDTDPDTKADLDGDVSAGDPETSTTAAAAGMFDVGDARQPEPDGKPLSDAEAAGLYDVPTKDAGGRKAQDPDPGSA